MLVNSLVMALTIAIGKIAILHHLGVRDRVLPVPVPDGVLLDDLPDAHAAGRDPDHADLQGRRRTSASEHVRGPVGAR
jgi:hypothetical protein